MIRNFLLTLLLAVSALGLSNCAPRPDAAATDPIRPDPLTHASVQLKIKKGETTQNDIVEAFGAPNIMTTDGDGREVWTYRRHASVSSVAGTDTYFNVFVFGAEDRRAGQTTSSRSMTLVIKFDAKKVVTDFQSMSTSF
jgi:hypothetical protein